MLTVLLFVGPTGLSVPGYLWSQKYFQKRRRLKGKNAGSEFVPIPNLSPKVKIVVAFNGVCP
jgi:hypothetical protein